jgi:hypothetical protein
MTEIEHSCALGSTSSLPPPFLRYYCAKKWIAVSWILGSLSACRLVTFCFPLGLRFDPEERGITVLRNVGGHLPDYTALHARR